MLDLFGNKIKRRLVVSASGGRTSAYMVFYLWFEWPERDDWDMIVVFANTGKEDPATLVFVHECSWRWNIPIIWVEGHHLDDEGNPFSEKGWSVKHKIVDYFSAHTGSERIDGTFEWTPFEEMISVLGIPSTNAPFCSDQLKRKVIEDYLSSIGWNGYYKAIGIRSDEIDRMNPKFKEKKILYPLIKMGITKPDILSWWGKQAFNLLLEEDLGNCDVCWKKDLLRLCRIAKIHPNKLNWWKYITKKYGHLNPRETDLVPPFNFYRGNLSPWDIEKISQESENGINERAINERLDGCSDSCEAF